MKRKIIVMQGTPCSGKSTVAKEIYNSDPNKYVIVSRDNIRDSRGNYWVPKQEDYISKIEEFSVRAALENKLIPILDSTNLNPNTIEKWEKLAKEYNVEIEYKPLYVPFKTALERDGKRDRPVGKNVLKRFYLKYFPEEYAKEMWTVDISKLPKLDEKYDYGTIIFDIDNTIAYSNGRHPYGWDDISNDLPDPRMKLFLNSIFKDNLFDVVFLTGRNEAARENTTKWIIDNIPNSWLEKEGLPLFTLYMRKNGDYSPGAECKREIFETQVKPNHKNILMVFDDDLDTIKMYQELGIYTCQVKGL